LLILLYIPDEVERWRAVILPRSRGWIGNLVMSQ
jgi:hypothetical protein